MPGRHGMRRGFTGLLVAIVASVALLQGCSEMEPEFDPTEPPPGHGPFTGTVADWPLWFIWHNFGTQCFSVQGCKIVYAGYRHGVDQPFSSLQSLGRPIEKVLHASRGPIRNFPPPAQVSWIAQDGTALTASVDIAEIFADRLVRHTVPREDILENSDIPYPGIILVVDDRTISVYMSTWMSLKQRTDPDNPYSDHHSGLVLVHSKTY